MTHQLPVEWTTALSMLANDAVKMLLHWEVQERINRAIADLPPIYEEPLT